MKKNRHKPERRPVEDEIIAHREIKKTPFKPLAGSGVSGNKNTPKKRGAI